MIPPTIPPAPLPAGVENLKVPRSMYKEEHLSFSCIELYVVSHMHYSLVGLVAGVSVWEVVWESEPWNEKIGVRFYFILDS